MNHQSELLRTDRDRIGVIIVDHGSRREESNELLIEVAQVFRSQTGWRVVEPAHMELAEPTIATAFARCVEQGAQLVVVFPYFLAPGKHWHEDIPHLAAEAAQAYPDVRHVVTEPLGLHPLMMQIIAERIADSLK
jgi:sirohydrochlorin ferrochelatase